MIYSMTGFSSRSFSFQGQQFRIEFKSLNHRFLDLKLRIPREWNTLDLKLRALVEKRLKRGSVELWIERQQAAGSSSELQLNKPQANQVYGVLSQIKDQFKIEKPISVRDIASFTDVIVKGGVTAITEEQWPVLQSTIENEVQSALEDLVQMRAKEGQKLQKALLAITAQFKSAHQRLLAQRELIQSRSREKVRKRIEQCFEAYPTRDAQFRALMDTRISQEIALALDRLDIEEELTRYCGHIVELEKLLNEGGPGNSSPGKKLDFLLQELNREVNTLGNKSQDIEMSQEVIQLKMWVEQLREQCMNLE